MLDPHWAPCIYIYYIYYVLYIFPLVGVSTGYGSAAFPRLLHAVASPP